MFPVLCDYIANKPLINTQLIFSDIQQYMEVLSENFTKYFLKESYDNFDWIPNPFLLLKLIFQDAKKNYLNCQTSFGVFLLKIKRDCSSFRI